MVVTVPALALRWGWLLASHAIHERVPWLTRAYFVAYTAGQVLPTSLGGDAVRVVETTRRHPGRATVVTGTVVLERGLGGAATVALGAIGFVLHRRVRRQRVPVARGFRVRDARSRVLSSRAPRGRCCAGRSRSSSGSGWRGRCVTSTRASTTSAPSTAAGKVLAVTLVVQAVRILSIWAARRRSASTSTAHLLRLRAAALPRDARAIHAERARRSRGVLRELPRQRRGRRDQAFAAGFLYFLVTLLLSFPAR